MFLLLTTDFLDTTHTHPPRAGGRTIYSHGEQELTTGEILRKQEGWGGGWRAVRVSFSMFYQKKTGEFGEKGSYETGSAARMRHTHTQMYAN